MFRNWSRGNLNLQTISKWLYIPHHRFCPHHLSGEWPTDIMYFLGQRHLLIKLPYSQVHTGGGEGSGFRLVVHCCKLQLIWNAKHKLTAARHSRDRWGCGGSPAWDGPPSCSFGQGSQVGAPSILISDGPSEHGPLIVGSSGKPDGPASIRLVLMVNFPSGLVNSYTCCRSQL